MDRGADTRVADAESLFEQRLRADGAKQPNLHQDGHGPLDTEAAGEGSMNLTKQLSTSLSHFSPITILFPSLSALSTLHVSVSYLCPRGRAKSPRLGTRNPQIV